MERLAKGVRPMKRFAMIAALVLGGCASTGYYDDRQSRYYDPYPAYPPVQTARGSEASIVTAQQACSIEPLNAAREAWTTEIREGGYGSRWGQAGSGRTERRLETSERPWGPQTETVELVRAFETDLDAAYRFATAACQSYALCMEERGYDEYACQGSADQWREARTEFNAMSGRLAEIRLEIAEDCRDCHRGWRPYHGDGHYRGARHYRHHPGDRRRTDDCDGILGEVFTTGECDYQQNDHYRGDAYHHHSRYRY